MFVVISEDSLDSMNEQNTVRCHTYPWAYAGLTDLSSSVDVSTQRLYIKEAVCAILASQHIGEVLLNVLRCHLTY